MKMEKKLVKQLMSLSLLVRDKFVEDYPSILPFGRVFFNNSGIGRLIDDFDKITKEDGTEDTSKETA